MESELLAAYALPDGVRGLPPGSRVGPESTSVRVMLSGKTVF